MTDTLPPAASHPDEALATRPQRAMTESEAAELGARLIGLADEFLRRGCCRWHLAETMAHAACGLSMRGASIGVDRFVGEEHERRTGWQPTRIIRHYPRFEG